MKTLPILIHTHFHRNRTGVTRSIENVYPFFQGKFDTYIHGYGVRGKQISTRSLLKIVFAKKYFVMHCHRNNEILRALFYRALGGKFKLISTRHAETKPSSITKYLLTKSDFVVTLTKNMASQLGFPSVVIGHGVDQSLFRPRDSVLRSEITQRSIITCAGRVREAKGQKMLLQQVAPVLKQNPKWALAIIGKVENPKFWTELKDIISKYKVESQVYFIPETPEIISFYQASHSVIIPSFSEGFSLVCAEAMSCACNVIASKGVGVHSEMITNAETGYLFDINNPVELKELIGKNCSGELAHLGVNAQKEISKKWSSKLEAEKLMKLYD